MSKKENIELQIRQARQKVENLQMNNKLLATKKENIEKAILANNEKIRKIQFFLQKLEESSRE